MRTPYLNRLRDNTRFPLTDQAILGRHSECDVALVDEPGLSRKHARFSVEGNVVHISDIGSLNGTLVNNRVVWERCPLANGDRLIFDEDEFEFIIPVRVNGVALNGRAAEKASEVATRLAPNGAFEIDKTASIRDLNAEEVAHIKSRHKTAKQNAVTQTEDPSSGHTTASANPEVRADLPYFDLNEKFSTTGVWQNNRVHPDAPIAFKRPTSFWRNHRWILLVVLGALIVGAVLINNNARLKANNNVTDELSAATGM